jgi:exo-1,4-beta-D-glucosaminidase
MKNFCDKMQLVNADGYRGIFEAAGHKLNETGGVMLWKLNAAFPSVVWQVYDWYLEPNAGYYFMQNACEPVHVQLNLDDSMVAVVNRTYHPQADLSVHAEVLDMNGRSLYSETKKLSLDTSDVKKALTLSPVLSKADGIAFVVLHLQNAQGKTISQNVYWMQPHHDYTALSQMRPAQVAVKILNAVKEKNNYRYSLQFTNTSDQFAFFINPQLTLDDEEITPSFWSNNYFSLTANESITVTVSCPLEKLNGMQPTLVTSGWNIAKEEMRLQAK